MFYKVSVQVTREQGHIISTFLNRVWFDVLVNVTCADHPFHSTEYLIICHVTVIYSDLSCSHTGGHTKL